MTNETIQIVDETCEPKYRGFHVTCPACGEENCMEIDLCDVAGRIHCSDCEGEFTVEQIRRVVTEWSKALDWLETAPFIH